MFRGLRWWQEPVPRGCRVVRFRRGWVDTILVLVALGCGDIEALDDISIATASEPVVYGKDDRIEIHEASAELQSLANGSLVALIPRTRLRGLPSGEWLINAEPLVRAHELCDGVRFSEQPSAATCSGTLATERLVLTANHCVTNDDHCNSLAFVFGYRLRSDGSVASLTEDDVYSCGRIAASTFDREQGLDVAWIELDRPVRGHHPIQLLGQPPRLSTGTRLSAIGFGQGLPAKVDPDVRVLTVSRNYFAVSSDAFVGSSGMPVFDANLELVGFSMRGEDDYEWAGDCQVPRVLDVQCENCSYDGEQIAYMAPALDLLETSIRASGIGAETLSELGGSGWPGYDDRRLSTATLNGGTGSHELSISSAGTAGDAASKRTVRPSGSMSCAVDPRSHSCPWNGTRILLLVVGIVLARSRQKARERG